MSSQAVILIPGIKGTKLLDSNQVNHDTIWSGVQSNFEDIDSLTLSKEYYGDFFDQQMNTIIKPSEVEWIAYNEIVQSLKHYTGKDVFIFNYDWRMSNVENGERLKEFVAYLIKKSKALKGTVYKKFDFITHSMGNQVMRSYMHAEGLSYVNKVMFTVPPFLGALDIVSAAIKGEGWFVSGRDSMRKLVRTWPGAVELLPKYARASEYTDGSTHNLFNPDHWQDNLVVENPNDRPTKNERRAKFSALINRGEDMVTNEMLDLLDLSSAERKRMLVVVRDGYKTLQSMHVIKESPDDVGNLFLIDRPAISKDGDGKVPHASSCCYARPNPSGILTLALKKAFRHDDKSHGFVMNEGRIQRIAAQFFNSSSLDFRIPSRSVKRVIGLEESSWYQGLPRWQLEYKD